MGVSRYIDSKHNVSDIIGGFMLGAMIGLVFVLRVRDGGGWRLLGLHDIPLFSPNPATCSASATICSI